MNSVMISSRICSSDGPSTEFIPSAVEGIQAAARDEAVDDLVEHRARAPKTSCAGQRQARKHRAGGRQHLRKLVHHQPQRLANQPRRFALVASEKRLRGDSQRQFGHRAVGIEGLVRRNPLDEVACVALHDARVLRDTFAVKGRLHDAAHLPVQRLFAREQSVAEQQAQDPSSQ
jgi:hypothetical protein